MPGYSRITMPENFYDITSDMLLTQPEPQYLYAQLFKNALAASLQAPSAFGQVGRDIGGTGSAYSSEERDRLMLSNPLSTDLFASRVDFNGMPGSTIRINRPVFANSTYTAASRQVTSGQTISTTPISVSSEQANLTLFTYGGPYDNTAADVAPYSINRFDAQFGVHRAASLHGTHLKRDFDRFLDSVWTTLFDLGATTVYPDGMTADNDATTAGSFPFSFEQLTRTERLMDDANVPTFADGYRILVLTPTQEAQLSLDDDYVSLSRNHSVYNALFPQYVASVKKFHIFKSTTLTTASNSSSVNIHRGHALAPGVGLAGMGMAPKVCPNTNDNYGQNVMFVWLADLAFALANNGFSFLVSSSE